ncbi:hypothetical protein FQN50_002456 [Emmonsiellopsis sp. PD_5]|nr:hypothetical protein FQN50_002456 [Emmonsiellopsis sp. PD_5]
MAPLWLRVGLILVSAIPALVSGQEDTLGLSNGYVTFQTANFNIQIVKDAQVLASLQATDKSFDFLPFDYISRRARDGQYHWGDLTFRYRLDGSTEWIDGDSASARQPVISLSTDALAASLMGPTLPSDIPLNVTREWLDVSGDLGLQFTIANFGEIPVEIGSLGFPTEFNSIFTDRTAEEIQEKCSLTDPYIGMHAGYLQVAPVNGAGSALVVTPLEDTPFEAYRNLPEASYEGTYYGSQTFEGFYEWQVLTQAWAENEWSGVAPWNPPSSRVLQPDESMHFGVRFSVAKNGIRGTDAVIRDTETPYAVGVPGYIVSTDLPARLSLFSSSQVDTITTEPVDAFTITELEPGFYQLEPSSSTWGRVRVTVQYANAKIQTVHYYVVKSATEAIGDIGNFLTTSQWFDDTSDPFGRAPSVMSYDYETQSIVTQDDRVWIAGLSDEGGAGSFLAATIKQAARPNADELSKLEEFVDSVLWGTIQTEDFGVRKSLFFYEPSAVPEYGYSPDIDWSGWASWNRDTAYLTDRAYNYVHVAAAYWALYRVGRAYPDTLTRHSWNWYLDQAYNTVMRCMEEDANGNPTVGYSRVGLMGETVFGEILADLKREGNDTQADAFTAKMQSRALQWDGEEVPFGSEMAWDSTGQEGVYYWCKYFAYDATATKAMNTVLAFMPSVPHWGWNGNARRYWDNIYGGKLRRIERQIHHYGSGLNALVLLSAFRSNPTDSYLLRVGYGGMNGPLSNIHQDGFAAASFHSWPDTLAWDSYSGDYGPSFLGLILGSATYVVEDEDVGLVAYGGILSSEGGEGTITVQTRDAVRRKVFIGPLGLLIHTDAGIIEEFSYDIANKVVSVVLSQVTGVPSAQSAIVWVETTYGETNYTVITSGLEQERMGWKVPLNSTSPVAVQVGPS